MSRRIAAVQPDPSEIVRERLTTAEARDRGLRYCVNDRGFVPVSYFTHAEEHSDVHSLECASLVD